MIHASVENRQVYVLNEVMPCFSLDLCARESVALQGPIMRLFRSCQSLSFTSDFLVLGVLEAGKSAFVLVAGGLGERLGYSGIKIALPSESATGKSYLQLYAETILAIQAKCQALGDKQCSIPFVLMTSDDTHSRTVEFLESNGLFGLQQEQVLYFNLTHSSLDLQLFLW